MVTEPAEDITIELSGFEDTDITADPDTVTFTPDNWNTPEEYQAHRRGRRRSP